jgi:hypothetical protein
LVDRGIAKIQGLTTGGAKQAQGGEVGLGVEGEVKLNQGDKVGVRLNLNIRKTTGENVLSVHDRSFRGKVLGHSKAMTLRNVKFSVNENAAEKIASGESDKFPMASVDGEYVKTDKHNTDGVEIYFNPKVSKYFVDSEGNPVASAKEVSVIGNKIYATDIKYKNGGLTSLPLSELNKIPKGRLHNSAESQQKLKEDISKNGIQEPLVLIYSVKDNALRLKEGHHRLDAANNLGLTNVPVKVQVEWNKSIKEDSDIQGQKLYHPPSPLDVEGYKKRNYQPTNIELGELGFKEQPLFESAENLPQGGEVKETVSEKQVPEPLKDVESTTKALEGVNTALLEAPLLSEIAGGSIVGKTAKQIIAEAYHKAKADKSNPDLVQAVEELLAPKETAPTQKVDEGQAKPIGESPQDVTGNIGTDKDAAEKTKATDKDVDKVAEATGTKAKSIRDLYDINRKLFGQDRVKSLAAAVAMDRMIGVMAKRAGTTKAEMYARLEFKKDTEANVLKADNALFQGTINGENVTLRNTDIDVVNGFYSPLRKIIAEAKQDKMPAKQWAEKFAKGDEAKWTGLTDWLAQQQGSVSKADILDYLKNNRVSVVEVVKQQHRRSNEEIDTILNKNKPDGTTPMRYYGTKNKYGYKIVQTGEFIEVKEPELVQLMDELRSDKFEERGTKFSQYQLEGDKSNYKEVLVTLPSSETEEQKQKRIDDIDKKRNELKSKIDSLYNQRKDETKEYKDLVNEREQLGQERNKITYNQTGKDFRSSHFAEPNILVHLRMNTRTDAEGNKVLFLEEVQSDWGQKGKKEGFVQKVDIRINKNADEYSQVEVFDTETGKTISAWQTRLAAEQEKSALNDARKTPTAPFVTDTNAWVKLGLKVALKEAVAQGATKIAWTTGEQQNDRYDLAKTVSVILYNDNGRGGYDVFVKGLNGEKLYANENASLKDVEATLGKDIADKMANNAGDVELGDVKSLKGDNLKVGGKGMKGFYGSPTEGSLGIVGNVAKSLFKQDVGTVELPLKDYSEKISQAKEFIQDFRSDGNEAKAKEWEGKLKLLEEKNNNQKQNSITVTPELRTQVQNGLALFQKQQGQNAKGAMVAADGNFVIYALTDPNVSTPLHEVAHIFEHYLTDGERATINNWAKTGAWTTETSEKFARGFEKYLSEGIAPTEGLKKIFEKFKTWLTDIYNGIKGSDIDIELNDDMRSIYAKMLGEDAVPAKKAKAAKAKTTKPAIPTETIDKLVGKATDRRAAVEAIADENIKEVAKAVTDTKVIDKVMDAIDNNDQLLADLEKKLGMKKICKVF